MSENPSPETFSALIAQKREEVNRLESLAWAATSARVEAEDELNVLLIASKPDPWPTPEMVDGIRIAVQNCREKKPTSSHRGSGCGPESAPNIARWEARGWVRIPNNAPYLARYSGRGDPSEAASYGRGAPLFTGTSPDWAGADFFRPWTH